MREAILLVDCNSFFVSCELIFRPDLKGRPVVVLSNNDGCVVARSKEAKQIGIAMCAPLFTIQHLVKTFNVVLFSSNFSLYNDISNRVMHVLRKFSEKMECYSIDEAFITLTVDKNIANTAAQIRKTVLKEVGVPVSIGISWSKTLAKIASEAAKNTPTGIFELLQERTIEQYLKKTDVTEIWGVGRKNGPKLHSYGIFSALDLRTYDKQKLRKLFNIVLVKTALELNGTPSFSLEEIPKFPQSITKSRSFGEIVYEKSVLKEAISSYAVQAAEKLYGHSGTAAGIIVFVTTNRFKESYYSNSKYIPLPHRTYHPPTLIQKAFEGLEEIFIQGLGYKKAGVILVDLQPIGSEQLTLLDENVAITEKNQQLMGAFQKIKQRFGIEAIQFASEGLQKSWKAKKGLRSPLYTTCWEDILTIQI
jgi:DNA polymerase V